MSKSKGGIKTKKRERDIDGSRAVCRVSLNFNFPRISKKDTLTKFVVLSCLHNNFILFENELGTFALV